MTLADFIGTILFELVLKNSVVAILIQNIGPADVHAHSRNHDCDDEYYN